MWFLRKLNEGKAFAAEIEKANNRKPEVIRQSRIQADPLLKRLGELSSHGELVKPSPDQTVTKFEERVLAAGAWTLTATDRITDDDSKSPDRWLKLENGGKSVELGSSGGMVITMQGDQLEALDIPEEKIRPDIVASTFDGSEFGMRGQESSRLIRWAGGVAIISAPLSAHSEVMRNFIEEFVGEGTSTLAQATQVAA